MPMEYIISSLGIDAITKITNVSIVEEILLQLVQFQEEHFFKGHHKNVEKVRQKSWHNRHINNKQFHIGDRGLLYDSKVLKDPGKLKTHWLGPYVVIQITEGGVVKLQKLDGTPFKWLVNGSQQNPYQDSHSLVD